jgi:hypothetical protein
MLHELYQPQTDTTRAHGAFPKLIAGQCSTVADTGLIISGSVRIVYLVGVIVVFVLKAANLHNDVYIYTEHI